MRERGYRVHCGRWLVDGNPQIILFEVGSAAHKMNEYKHELFEKAGIGIPHEDIESNDVAIFGFMCAEFIASFRDGETKRTEEEYSKAFPRGRGGGKSSVVY